MARPLRGGLPFASLTAPIPRLVLDLHRPLQLLRQTPEPPRLSFPCLLHSQPARPEELRQVRERPIEHVRRMGPQRRVELEQTVDLELDADGRGFAAGFEEAAEEGGEARAVAVDDALEGDQLADGGRAGVSESMAPARKGPRIR